MRYVLVLGKRLSKSGAVPQEMHKQLRRTVRILRERRAAGAVISGGVTRRGCMSEARAALSQMPEDLRRLCVLEEDARTTAQNIINTRKLLQGAVSSLVLVTHVAHIPRARYLMKYHWSEMAEHTEYEGVGKPGVSATVVQNLHYMFNVLDPNEKWIVKALLKMKGTI